MYTDLTQENVKDYRAKGANHLFGLLYNQYLGQITNERFIEEANQISTYLNEYVRNIYECIHKEIPVLLYLDILDTDNMEDIGLEGITKKEALKQVKETIHNFYLVYLAKNFSLKKLGLSRKFLT